MSAPIHALIFSRDRAMQLDALLRSAVLRSPYASASVLTPNGDAAYRQVFEDHSDIGWHNEGTRGFEKLTREWIGLCAEAGARVAFHSDDEVWFRGVPEGLLESDEVIMFRQGRNTTFCHPLDCVQSIPAGFPRWQWRSAEHDFGYPLSLNATVYHATDLLPLLNFPFSDPNQLEAGLACQARNSFNREWCVAPEHSCTVSLPHNVTSKSSNNPRGGNPEWQADALTAKYLDGWRIDLDAMDFTDITAAHQEVPLVFCKP